MGKIIRSFVAVLTVLVLNGFGFVGHTVVVATDDGMDGMNHEQSNSATCATLCRTAVIDTDEQSKRVTEEENDDEPFIPQYVQLQDLHLDTATNLTKTCQSTIKPPPKVPIQYPLRIEKLRIVSLYLANDN